MFNLLRVGPGPYNAIRVGYQNFPKPRPIKDVLSAPEKVALCLKKLKGMQIQLRADLTRSQRQYYNEMQKEHKRRI